MGLLFYALFNLILPHGCTEPHGVHCFEHYGYGRRAGGSTAHLGSPATACAGWMDKSWDVTAIRRSPASSPSSEAHAAAGESAEGRALVP